ncbi:MAG: hypothetical protein NZM12_05720 [Steroidobacteraceae bacterium]|nr:hypothetical protein [Steroidobacteraceae bacterium]MDW8260579.1 hypothetical protein [Gammaproteobacteria bacterium]
MTAAQPSVPTPSTAPRRRRWAVRLLGAIVLLALAFAAWSYLALTYTYSEGNRAGILQKFSRKGWLCKTWEGELAQYVVAGVAPQIWYFTVRDPQLAAALTQRTGDRLRLHYREHRFVPTSCFGDTAYFVDAFSEWPADSIDPQR